MKQLAALISHFAYVLLLLQATNLAADAEHEIIGADAQSLPLFDAHMHYKRAAWAAYPPDVVLTMMDNNGVAMALVSSSPDQGTITLWEYAPRRIVPEMRPYDDGVGPSNWTKTAGVGDLIESRVRKYRHEGIGEFHLHRIDPADVSLLKRIVALAMEQDIPLHVRSNRLPVEYLYQLNPGLTIIWAHAGMTEPAVVVEEMMETYPTLYADTSYREYDILQYSGGIDPEWRRVLERFADRFMVGSDTWVNSQWEEYDHLIASNRQWLAYLTRASAKKIAYQNAERLFGRKIDQDLYGRR